jgi:dihydroflavonol-4-reductase
MEGVAALTRRPPQVSLTAVRMAKKRMFFSAAKAVSELGLPQTPPEAALADAVAWFVARGYAPRPANAA